MNRPGGYALSVRLMHHDVGDLINALKETWMSMTQPSLSHLPCNPLVRHFAASPWHCSSVCGRGPRVPQQHTPDSHMGSPRYRHTGAPSPPRATERDAGGHDWRCGASGELRSAIATTPGAIYLYDLLDHMPRDERAFAAVQDQCRAELAQFQLFSIAIDPEYDTPSACKSTPGNSRLSALALPHRQARRHCRRAESLRRLPG